MPGPYVHQIDPVIAEAWGLYFWWYGLSYTLGFLELHAFLARARNRIGLTADDVRRFSLLFIVCVLAGGRLVQVAFDEWPFYREHPWLIGSYWLGGMASHGLLLGAAAAVFLFAWRSGKPVLALADEIVIPGAFLLGLGRIGNFIDGQIVGSVTDVWWAVRFPDTEGFRHPVVLYDGAKNLLLVLLLLWVRRSRPAPGAVAAHFVFWYAFLRIFVDVFRDYPTHRLGFPTGQTLNIVMALAGAALLVRSRVKRRPPLEPATAPLAPDATRWPRLAMERTALAGLLVFCLTIPGNWTQDVPERYGKRHPGLHHSWLYPRIETTVPRTGQKAAALARRVAGGTEVPPDDRPTAVSTWDPASVRGIRLQPDWRD
jgi:phosphatidylglycerol:prolipoprotein diacylglycerol transferase